MVNKLLSVLLVFAVILSGCIGQQKAETPAADTTEQSISDAGSVDSDLSGEDVQNVDSDLEEVENTLS